MLSLPLLDTGRYPEIPAQGVMSRPVWKGNRYRVHWQVREGSVVVGGGHLGPDRVDSPRRFKLVSCSEHERYLWCPLEVTSLSRNLHYSVDGDQKKVLNTLAANDRRGENVQIPIQMTKEKMCQFTISISNHSFTLGQPNYNRG